ncbi:MAG: nucleotidyltransferase family protein [Gemmatimonadetes bacterium]|nr:nucleotidyltransferase family protein [Gemmatimonadota bacterium]MYK99983.1 nucleotidyltransferase family protein [Gemmatimonadota bacterium]
MITGLVLAAGRSERMGTPKQLLPFGGVTLIEHVVRTLTRSRLGKDVVVVLGDRAMDIVKRISGLPVRLAYNPDPEGDMVSSIRCGLAYIEPEQAIMIALGDQPLVTTGIVNRLFDEYEGRPEGMVLPVHDGKRGHPMILSPAYREEILFEAMPGGLKALRDRHSGSVRAVPVDTDAVLIDLDYRSEYEEALRRWKEESESGER